MAYLRGLGLAATLFAACFALHVVGGATDQDWLFGLAVVLIYITASGFGAIAWLLAGRGRGPGVLAAGVAIGVILTTSALRAANDRNFEVWQPPLAVAMVAISTAVILFLATRWKARRTSAVRAAA